MFEEWFNQEVEKRKLYEENPEANRLVINDIKWMYNFIEDADLKVKTLDILIFQRAEMGFNDAFSLEDIYRLLPRAASKAICSEVLTTWVSNRSEIPAVEFAENNELDESSEFYKFIQMVVVHNLDSELVNSWIGKLMPLPDFDGIANILQAINILENQHEAQEAKEKIREIKSDIALLWLQSSPSVSPENLTQPLSKLY